MFALTGFQASACGKQLASLFSVRNSYTKIDSSRSHTDETLREKLYPNKPCKLDGLYVVDTYIPSGNLNA